MNITQLTTAINNGIAAVQGLEQQLLKVPFDVILPIPTLNGTVAWLSQRGRICFTGPGEDGTPVTELDPLLMLKITTHAVAFSAAVDQAIADFLSRASQG